jgi:hypothetical protein
MDEKEVLGCTGHRSRHCRRTRRLLRQKGCDFDAIDTTYDAVLCALG